MPVVSAQTTLNDADVDISDHPYVVSITRRGKHVCSGAIIDAYNIVTSDRCVPPFKHVWNIMNDIVVVSGTSSIKPGGGVRIFAKEMFSQNHQNHENPNENHVSSGLGLIKVDSSFSYREFSAYAYIFAEQTKSVVCEREDEFFSHFTPSTCKPSTVE